jgi:hypothetical protein
MVYVLQRHAGEILKHTVPELEDAVAYANPTTDRVMPYMYNVEQAVGVNSPNASGDVKLVQYMLKGIYKEKAANLVVDGYIGPITVGWIRTFQSDIRQQNGNVMIDGRVDRAFSIMSSVSRTVYTIVLLNWKLSRVNPAAYAALPASVPLNGNPRPNPYNPKPEPGPGPEPPPFERAGTIRAVDSIYAHIAKYGHFVDPGGSVYIWKHKPGGIVTEIYDVQTGHIFVLDSTQPYKIVLKTPTARERSETS